MTFWDISKGAGAKAKLTRKNRNNSMKKSITMGLKLSNQRKLN